MGFQRQAVLKLLIYMIQQSQEIRESQIDVVDKIGDKFSDIMENYDASSINFPKRRTTTRRSQPIEKHTRSKVNT
jgi:hypothetical protein